MEVDLRKMLGELQRIPNQLTALRVVLTVALWWLVGGNRAIFVGVFIVAGLTDVADGYLARRLRLQSDFGRDFDALADGFMIVCAPWLLDKLCPGLLGRRTSIFIFVVACLLVSQLVAVVKLRQPVCFHHYTDKGTGFLSYVIFVTTVVLGDIALLWYVLAAAVAVQSLETILVCLLIDDPLHHARPSLLLYDRASRGKGAAA
jgi:CDP-diacylglycerol--glycerol-3-phosphate 3-phosphatidyltransferase